MSATQTDVIVHIDEALSSEGLSQVVAGLGKTPGVSGVAPPRKGHLLVIRYDAHATSAKAILDAVSATGVHAELIGL